MFRRLSLAASALLAPTAALAHAGHETGSFLAGMQHPVGGTDHLLAMVAVGLWAAQTGGRALWAAPLTFVGAMLAGGAAGAAGLPFPAVEPMILASVILLGALIALAARLPLAVVLPVLAAFGAAHGWAHGAEGPTAGMATYALGFAVMTAALHGAGLLGGLTLQRLASLPVSRALGGVTALAGLALAVGA